MTTISVPAQIYDTVCLGCRGHVAVPMFRGGGFFNFGTYRGQKTGAFYRVDLDRMFYGKIDLETELKKAAAEFESGFPLQLVPDKMSCPRCGELVALSEADLATMPPPAETSFDAIPL
jgi:hypothetical protein